MDFKSGIEKLLRKYETLIDYGRARQEIYIGKANEASQKYKETGNHIYYQDSENYKNLSSRLSAEVRSYRTFRDDLKEVLNNADTDSEN